MVVTTNTDVLYAGDQRTQKFTITDEDGGGAFDLTGYTVYWQLLSFNRPGNYANRTPLITKDSGTAAEITVTDAANGLLEVYLVGTDSATIPRGDYYFELEVEDGSNEFVTVGTGTMEIREKIPNS